MKGGENMILNTKTLSEFLGIKSFKTVTLSPEQYEQLKQEPEYHPPFYLSDHMLSYIDVTESKGNISVSLIPIATYIKVVERQHNIATDEYTYLVAIKNNGVLTQLILKGEELVTLNFKNLIAYGFLFEEQYSKLLQKYLVQSANESFIKTVHSTLGWIDEKTYLSNKVYSKDDIQSEYIGKTDLTPKGNKEIYIDFINSNVLENIPLLFVWLLGFASAILSYLNQFRDIGCLLVGLNNLSSKGKTTAAMLATSVTSNPVFDRGLMTNFSGTSNAILGYVSLFNGHTVVLDEVATNEAKNTRKLLYQLCSGRERKRLDTSGELKSTAEFSSIVLITGEFSIIDETASNGIRARVFEITEDLTESAEHSNIIKQTVLANYGLVYDEFLNYFIANLDDVLNDYDTLLEVLKSGFKGVKGELTDRVLEKLAVIYMTAYFVKACFSIALNMDGIKNYIYTLENRINTESDIADKALDCILDYISRNSSKFIRANISDYESCVEGKIVKNTNYVEVSILKSVAENTLCKNGFENIKTIAHKWQCKGILVSEGDRANKRIKLTKDLPLLPCYVFKLPMCNEHITKCQEIYDSVSSDNLDDVDIELK